MGDHRHATWYGADYDYVGGTTDTITIGQASSRDSVGVVINTNDEDLFDKNAGGSAENDIEVLTKTFDSATNTGTLTIRVGGDKRAHYPVGEYIAIEGVTPPDDSAYSTFNSTFTDPNKPYTVTSITYNSDGTGKTDIVVPFSSNEANNNTYTVTDAKVYKEDFRLFIYGLLSGMWNHYRTLSTDAEMPLNFKMTHNVGAYDVDNKCFYESFSLSFKRNEDSEVGTMNSTEVSSGSY
tara:strand:- start:44 stop:754 length:711 start_codon:yes stop_codon:yes gene_type:complete